MGYLILGYIQSLTFLFIHSIDSVDHIIYDFLHVYDLIYRCRSARNKKSGSIWRFTLIRRGASLFFCQGYFIEFSHGLIESAIAPFFLCDIVSVLGWMHLALRYGDLHNIPYRNHLYAENLCYVRKDNYPLLSNFPYYYILW